MPKSLSWQKLVQKLRRLGFSGPFPGGRHLFMRKNDFKLSIPNPHKGDLSSGLITRILREAEIDPEDWENA